MPAWAWVIVIVAIVAALVVWSAMRKRRTQRLQQSFGPEYDRTMQTTGGRRQAEAELEARRKRREQLDVRPLDPASRQRYSEQWAGTQSRFVDSPAEAVREADVLVIQVMRERGYPVDNFEQRSSDVSVDHPHVVENYRSAHAVSLANDQGQAGTEDLRQAMVHYRALFQDLLSTGENTGQMREAR
jgi:ABC-type nickel/cobalt efflux system permease component RcnA